MTFRSRMAVAAVAATLTFSLPYAVLAEQPAKKAAKSANPTSTAAINVLASDKLPALLSGITGNPEQQAKQLFNLLKTGNGVLRTEDSGADSRKPRLVDETLAAGGDCTEFAQVVLSAAKQLGLKGGAILVHMDGAKEDTDHMVAYVMLGGKKVFLDPQADELGAVGNRGYTVVAELDAIQAQGMYFRELGIYYRNQNNWQKAIEAFEQSLKLNPFDAFVHNKLAVAYERVGNHKQAAIHYKLAGQMTQTSAAADNVKNIDAKVQMEEFNKKMTAAERFFNKNNFSAAKKAFEEALAAGKGILSEEERQLVQDNIKACEQNMR